MMSYHEAIEYLYNRLPMFSKQGASAIKKDLVNIRKLCDALGNPQDSFKAIHVAGTNGKGSSSHMLASILQSAGYKTGLYTSPHLLDFRERIRVNGATISQEDVISFVSEHKTLIEAIEPSFFEVTVAMAFSCFEKQGIDVAVIETGLGGRLDSTNIIHPILSLITNISLDHVSILGNTLQEIAREKAGIIKRNTPVVISEKTAESAPIFEQKAKECGSKIIFAATQWTIQLEEKDALFLTARVNPVQEPEKKEYYALDLSGNYQLKNLAGVLSCVTELQHLGFTLAPAQVHDALVQVKSRTGLMGRWQTLAENPLIICDTGHNEKGWEEVLLNIQQQKYTQLHMVIGVMRDKDIDRLLKTLPLDAVYYFCRANFDRALHEQDLLALAQQRGFKGSAYPSISEAIDAARAHASVDDFIFIGGSSFVVAEALESFPSFKAD